MTTMGAKFASFVEWRSLLNSSKLQVLLLTWPLLPGKVGTKCLAAEEPCCVIVDQGIATTTCCGKRSSPGNWIPLKKEKKKKVQMPFSGAVASSVEKIVNR